MMLYPGISFWRRTIRLPDWIVFPEPSRPSITKSLPATSVIITILLAVSYQTKAPTQVGALVWVEILFYINPHTAGGAFYNLGGGIQIVGVQVAHFLFGNLADLG